MRPTMTLSRKIPALAFIILAAIGGALLFYRAFSVEPALPAYATVLPSPVPVPAFALLDEQGVAFTQADLRDQWSLLFFGFTHCPDICPATLQQLALARARVAERDGEFPQIILVSVDPSRDSPEVLAAYVKNFGENIKAVTGPEEQLRKLTAALGIYFATSDDGNGDYSVDHSAAVLLFDEDAMWRAVFSAPHAVENFVADVPLLTGAD